MTSQLAVNFYKRGRGFELTTTENKSSNRSEYDLNSGPLNCKSSALTTRQASSYQFSMLILKRDVIAVKIVMLETTKCVCEWETEKGSVLEAKHQQFYMRAHCSNIATTLTYIIKIKVWLKVSPKLLIIAEREGVLDKALPTSVWGAIRMAALFTVICFYFRWLSRSLGSKSLPTDCRHGKRKHWIARATDGFEL